MDREGPEETHMEPERNIRLIACDIDGTLVSNGAVVSPELKDIFAELARRDVAVTLATGRMPHRTVGVADELGLTEYLICTEGGHVFHRRTKDTIHYVAIDRGVIDAVAHVIESDPDTDLAAISEDVLWATTDSAGRHAHWWGDRYQIMRDIRDVPEPLLLMLFGEQAKLAEVCASLRARLPTDKAFIHEVEDQRYYGHFKICAPETDKGIGAERLVRHLGGDKSQVLAFGDYLNDLGIMRHVGHSICPANAHPLVRETASHVSPYTTEQGFVARELERIFGLA